jgi:hypothetical protein
MSTRRIVEHQAKSRDGELLQVIVIHQESVTKEQAKKENRYSKRHKALYRKGSFYEYTS